MPSIRKLLPLIALLAGCQYVPMLPGLTPYKIDVQQGNYVTEDMMAKVKPGMSKSQVRFALGTPLVVDPFHTDRWDYVYELKKRGRTVEHRRIVAIFDDDKLIRIDGEAAPAVAGAERLAPPASAPVVSPARAAGEATDASSVSPKTAP